jgi:hypothetical protein
VTGAYHAFNYPKLKRRSREMLFGFIMKKEEHDAVVNRRKKLNKVRKLQHELWDAVHELTEDEFKELMETDW